MTDSLAQDPTYWHWLILAVTLAGFEMVLPGVIFLWLALAAGALGILVALATTFSVPLSVQWQLLLFSGLAIISLMAGRQFWRRRQHNHPHPTLNQRGSEWIGRTFPLERAIVSGTGRIHAGDTLWLVSGPDLPLGTLVRVVGVDGATLLVEPA